MSPALEHQVALHFLRNVPLHSINPNHPSNARAKSFFDPLEDDISPDKNDINGFFLKNSNSDINIGNKNNNIINKYLFYLFLNLIYSIIHIMFSIKTSDGYIGKNLRRTNGDQHHDRLSSM